MCFSAPKTDRLDHDPCAVPIIDPQSGRVLRIFGMGLFWAMTRLSFDGAYAEVERYTGWVRLRRIRCVHLYVRRWRAMAPAKTLDLTLISACIFPLTTTTTTIPNPSTLP